MTLLPPSRPPAVTNAFNETLTHKVPMSTGNQYLKIALTKSGTPIGQTRFPLHTNQPGTEQGVAKVP